MVNVRCRMRNGRLEFVDPLPEEWEGLELRVEPTQDPTEDSTLTGTDPESIARWIRAMEDLKQFQMSDRQAEEWDQNLRELKDDGKRSWEQRSREIEGLFS